MWTLGKETALTKLVSSETDFSDNEDDIKMLPSLSKLTGLESLSLERCRMHDSGVKCLTQFRSLQHRKFSGNYVWKHEDDTSGDDGDTFGDDDEVSTQHFTAAEEL